MAYVPKHSKRRGTVKYHLSEYFWYGRLSLEETWHLDSAIENDDPIVLIYMKNGLIGALRSK